MECYRLIPPPAKVDGGQLNAGGGRRDVLTALDG
jgi:hypothetical protein